MTDSTSYPNHDELLRHGRFLRALARGILADRSLADDAVQEAFLKALVKPPADRGSLSSWLARVTRNVAHNMARGESRRASRQRAAARPEATRVDEEAQTHLEAQRRVLQAVSGLHEPYRSMVHLRYYRGMGPKRIARELGIPEKTVQARLTRAHGLLRGRLDRAWGSRESWAVLLLPGKSGGASSFAALGGILMTKNTVLFAVAAVSLLGIWLAWDRASVDPANKLSEAEQAVDGLHTAATARQETDELHDTGADRERSPVATASLSTEEESDAQGPSRTELESALDRMLSAIEPSLSGPFDPGALLDAALLIADMEADDPILELDRGGRLRFPIRGLPEGVKAELSLSGKNSRGEKVLTLQVQFDRPREPYIVDGLARESVGAQISTWTDDEGDFRHFSIATSLPTSEAPVDPEITSGVRIYMPMDAPYDWKLKAGGLKEVPGTLQADGGRMYKSADWELDPQLVVGRWPRVDDIERFSSFLLKMYDEARAR